MKKTRLALASAATALLSVAGLAVTQPAAQAATGAYGSTTSCKLSGTSAYVYIAPHFTIVNWDGTVMRRVDGYSFYTSPADKIIAVKEEVAGGGTTKVTNTNPNASSGARTNLGSYYIELYPGYGWVTFTVKDAAGHSCTAPDVRV